MVVFVVVIVEAGSVLQVGRDCGYGFVSGCWIVWFSNPLDGDPVQCLLKRYRHGCVGRYRQSGRYCCVVVVVVVVVG